MKHNVMLTIASLLSILLLTLHITDDIVRGISKAEPSNIALAVLVVLLYGTLVLAERRSGYVIMLLVGLFAAGMPVIHMRGAHYGEIAKSTGGLGDLAVMCPPHVEDGHACCEQPDEQHDDVPRSPFGEHQRPVQQHHENGQRNV